MKVVCPVLKQEAALADVSVCDQSLGTVSWRQQWFPTVCRLPELSQHHSTRRGRQSAHTRTLGQDFLVWAQRGRKSDASSHRHTQVSVSGVRFPCKTFLFMWELQMLSNLFTDRSFWLLWCELLPALASNVCSDGTKCWDNVLTSRMHFNSLKTISCILSWMCIGLKTPVNSHCWYFVNLKQIVAWIKMFRSTKRNNYDYN